jgi:2-oxoglutarate dehydrogenase E1 component
VNEDVLRKIGKTIFTPPAGFEPHRTIKRILQGKVDMIEKGEAIDWGAGESLAYGSLLCEGVHVRMSGQDVQRGTFSHRHAVVHDQQTGAPHCGLNTIEGADAEFHCFNSPLSEYGTMGFELGYSLESPNQLVIWEAQFGDFVNGAQIMIDQFLSCGEAKWWRQSGLVLLLPHGYDGQGPEHSSCRVERFLTMSDEDPDIVPEMAEDRRMQIQRTNWQVVNCTTPAQIFHVMRRQVHREFRKPLIVVAPKNMLKHKECVSPLEDFGPGSHFKVCSYLFYV